MRGSRAARVVSPKGSRTSVRVAAGEKVTSDNRILRQLRGLRVVDRGRRTAKRLTAGNVHPSPQKTARGAIDLLKETGRQHSGNGSNGKSLTHAVGET